jgi:pimeloyl-ACP methyl ester carboxylesterase/precorrin-6B methylase 2
MSRLIALALAAATILRGAPDKPYSDVPYVPTSEKTVDAMLDLAGIKPGDVLVDLGSGDGRIVLSAVKRFGIRATGVEIDPELVRQSQQSARQQGIAEKAQFVCEDLFEYDLRQATVVTVFLTPGVNLRLRTKLLRELRPGARIVSHRFDMGNWQPAKTIEVEGDRIYLWTVPMTVAEPKPEPVSTGAASLFSYDAAAPLNIHAEESQTAAGASITPVSFAGVRGPVSATLIAPVKKGRYPAVIFAHDYGRRDEFIPEALVLARATPAAVALLIDAPPERPVGWRRGFNAMLSTVNDQEIHIQAVIDIRRGIDFLGSRSDVDAQRLLYVGHGYGANWGVILAGIERRLRGFVLMAAVPSLAEAMQGDDPDWADTRYVLGSERFAAYKEAMSAIDPIGFVRSWVGAPILFQFGRYDSFVSRAMADRLTGAMPQPQTVEFYDAGHSVNDPRALADRSRFLARWIRR